MEKDYQNSFDWIDRRLSIIPWSKPFRPLVEVYELYLHEVDGDKFGPRQFHRILFNAGYCVQRCPGGKICNAEFTDQTNKEEGYVCEEKA